LAEKIESLHESGTISDGDYSDIMSVADTGTDTDVFNEFKKVLDGYLDQEKIS